MNFEARGGGEVVFLTKEVRKIFSNAFLRTKKKTLVARALRNLFSDLISPALGPQRSHRFVRPIGAAEPASTDARARRDGAVGVVRRRRRRRGRGGGGEGGGGGGGGAFVRVVDRAGRGEAGVDELQASAEEEREERDLRRRISAESERGRFRRRRRHRFVVRGDGGAHRERGAGSQQRRHDEQQDGNDARAHSCLAAAVEKSESAGFRRGEDESGGEQKWKRVFDPPSFFLFSLSFFLFALLSNKSLSLSYFFWVFFCVSFISFIL